MNAGLCRDAAAAKAAAKRERRKAEKRSVNGRRQHDCLGCRYVLLAGF